jgi:hypothetical protein
MSGTKQDLLQTLKHATEYRPTVRDTEAGPVCVELLISRLISATNSITRPDFGFRLIYLLIYGVTSPINYLQFSGRDSSVGTATGYELEGRGCISGRGKKIFLYPKGSGPVLAPLSLLSSGYRGLFPWG